MSTKISWAATKNTDGSISAGDTWNPLIGCSKISAGCQNCYAIKTAWIRQHNPKMKTKYEGVVEKTAAGNLNWTGRVNMHNLTFAKPLKQKKATTYFVNSMSDLFHENVPFDFIKEVYMVMVKCKQHTFQVLTKRPERAEEFYDAMREEMPNGFDHIFNIHLGVSVENQEQAHKRIPVLLRIPAEIRFLSCEPLLGPVNLSYFIKTAGRCMMCGGSGKIFTDHVCPKCDGREPMMQGGSPIDLVITGGESGAKARGSHPQWFKTIRDHCEQYKVPFHHKQNGEYYTKEINPISLLPKFTEYYSYNHFLQAAKQDKKNIYVSIDGTQCKSGVDFAKCSYPVVELQKVGVKTSGNLLDGIEYKSFVASIPR